MNEPVWLLLVYVYPFLRFKSDDRNVVVVVVVVVGDPAGMAMIQVSMCSE